MGLKKTFKRKRRGFKRKKAEMAEMADTRIIQGKEENVTLQSYIFPWVKDPNWLYLLGWLNLCVNPSHELSSGSTVDREASDKERQKDIPTFKDNDFLNDKFKISIGEEAKVGRRNHIHWIFSVQQREGKFVDQKIVIKVLKRIVS